MLGKTEHIHFVGIGGIGMSGLATILHNLKFVVSGSDINRSEITHNLKQMGIRIKYKHTRENVKGADVLVYSSAIKEDNLEIIEAKRRRIPIISRGELLAELTRMKLAICISGTHGKTTTTSMIGEILTEAGLSPTIIVGGIIRGKSQAQLGKKEYLVCEADESDRSFLKLFPSYAVITNIEEEHLDYYKDLEDIKNSFVHFANNVPFWGATFLCADSINNLAVLPKIMQRCVLYGFNEDAALRAIQLERVNYGSSFRVNYQGKFLGKFRLQLMGEHNVINALAAIGVGIELGIPVEKIRHALASFVGVKRRLEYLGELNGARVFDDYGHHPTEIAVTLATLRQRFPEARIISIFQPHRYTRTYHLFDKLALSFLNANVVVVTEIYGAHELPIIGVSGRALTRRIAKEQDNVYFISDFSEIMKFIRKTATYGDIIVIQGAGNISQLSRQLFNKKGKP